MEEVVADRLSTAIKHATTDSKDTPNDVLAIVSSTTNVEKNSDTSETEKKNKDDDLTSSEDKLLLQDDHELFYDFRDDEADLFRRLERHLRISHENSKKMKKKHKDNSSMDGLRSGDDGEYHYSSDDENESEDRRRQSTAESSGTNLNVDFNYGDIIERTPEEIFDTFLNSYKGFARFKELLIRDGFDDMEALIYAKKKDLLDIMPKKAAIRFYKVLKREKPHWKIVYRKQREQIEIERAEEREREERLKKEEEGWFVGEYGSEEEEDYDDELMHDGFHDGHNDY